MCWYSWQFSSLFCHHPLTMGSISFRQGQKALACRLAHCVALTNDVAWKKPIRHYCTYVATSFSNQHWLDLFSNWWWWRQDHDDETKLAHHTSLTALPLCSKIPGNRSGSGQRRQIERVRRLFCTCYFDLWGFELSICINLCLSPRGLCM